MHYKKINMEKVKAFATFAKEKASVCVDKVSNKVSDLYESSNVDFSFMSKIHFNLHHFTTVTIIAVLTFFVASFSLGYNTSSVNAAGLEAKEVSSYNKKAIDVNYGDTKAIAALAKDILSDQVSSASELNEMSKTAFGAIYSLDTFVVGVEMESTTGEASANLSIQTKTTYDKGESEKIAMENGSALLISDGVVYTYNVKLNVIDTSAPVINLSQSEVTIAEDDDFDARSYVASVVDNVDGTIDFTIEGEVAKDGDTFVVGEYTLIVRAKDASGNEASADLKVIVEEKEEEVEESSDSTSSQSYGSYAESAYAGSIVAEARSLVGSAYVYGAAGPNAFDCSGFVQYVYSRSGVSIPRTSGGQSGVGVAIDPNDVSQWRAGDIVTFGVGGSAHAAIYSGSGTLIHALNPSQGVQETGIYGFGTIYAVRRVQ